MELSRIYDETDLARYKLEREQTNAAWQGKLKAQDIPEKLIDGFAKQICDEVVPAPAIAGVDVVHTGIQAEQNFSTSLITEFIKLGIAEIEGEQLILHTASDDLIYTIKRTPGRWCLHCGEKLPDDAGGELARLHMAMNHNGESSPSANDPAGYVWLTYFECVLDAAQHSQYQKVV